MKESTHWIARMIDILPDEDQILVKKLVERILLSANPEIIARERRRIEKEKENNKQREQDNIDAKEEVVSVCLSGETLKFYTDLAESEGVPLPEALIATLKTLA